jgi:hypothetical protein
VSVNTLTNPQALLLRVQKDRVAYDPPLPFTTVAVRCCAATCTATPPSVAEHAAHVADAALVAGFGATVGFFVEGAGAAAVSVSPVAAAVVVSTGDGGMNAGARLPELGALVLAGVAATGAAPAHPAINRAVTAPTTTRAVENSVFLNS